MAKLTELAGADRVQDAVGGSAPVLHEYQKTHKVQGVPLLGRLELSDCTRLILYNVQGFMVAQVWTKLQASLGELAWSILQIKRVSHLNRNPHMDLWVRKNADIALSSAPEVTSSYVTTWVRVGVNRARACTIQVASSMFRSVPFVSIEFWTMRSASFS